MGSTVTQWQNILNGLYAFDVQLNLINLTCHTFLYGIYLCLIPIVIHIMIANGLQSRARKWLLFITTSMFALSTVVWILSVAILFLYVDSLPVNGFTVCHHSDNARSCVIREVAAILASWRAASWLVIFTDLLLINYVIADGVVVWRAWVLCSDQSKVVLMIPVVLLAINTLIYLMTVTLRAIEVVSEDVIKWKIFLDVAQGTHLTFSLLINICATSIISRKAWKYRKLLIESGIGIRTPRQAIRILAVLVESGMIYILFSVASVFCIIIPLCFGLRVIPSVSTITGSQLVGIYPIIVILLVEKNRSLDSTFYSSGTVIDVRGNRPLQAEPMIFAPGPVLESGGQIDLATKPPLSATHAPFNSALDPADVGIGAGNSKVSSEEHAA